MRVWGVLRVGRRFDGLTPTARLIFDGKTGVDGKTGKVPEAGPAIVVGTLAEEDAATTNDDDSRFADGDRFLRPLFPWDLIDSLC